MNGALQRLRRGLARQADPQAARRPRDSDNRPYQPSRFDGLPPARRSWPWWAAGLVLGALLTLLVNAPATWLAAWIHDSACCWPTILYGGSVKADNAATLFAQPDIDGGLIGGSLKAADFIAICRAG